MYKAMSLSRLQRNFDIIMSNDSNPVVKCVRHNNLVELCKMRQLTGTNFRNGCSGNDKQQSSSANDDWISCEPVLPSTELSLLHIAALYDSLDCFIYLHKCANLDLRLMSANSYLPIHYACFNGSYEVLSYIIANDPTQATLVVKELRYQPIYLATRSGSVDCLRLLLDNGADLSVDENKANQPVQTALQFHSAECLKLLLSRGTCSDELDGATQYSPLMRAISLGYKDAVRQLLQIGEDPGFISKGNNKMMALFLACGKGPEWAEEVELICSKLPGARDVDGDYPGMSAIHYACMSRSPRILEAVCQLGVEVTRLAKDNKGRRTNTAVHYLVQNDELEDGVMIRMLEILVRYGFDLNSALAPFIKGPQKKRYDVIEWILKHPNVNPETDNCHLEMERISKKRYYDVGAKRMYDIYMRYVASQDPK